jgi:hypothetical protein
MNCSIFFRARTRPDEGLGLGINFYPPHSFIPILSIPSNSSHPHSLILSLILHTRAHITLWGEEDRYTYESKVVRARVLNSLHLHPRKISLRLSYCPIVLEKISAPF